MGFVNWTYSTHAELPANNVKDTEEWSIIMVNNADIPYIEFRKYSNISSSSVLT
jgi:hypothetical protein